MEPSTSSSAPACEPDSKVLQRLRRVFAQLPDTRQPGKVRHRLDEMLTCSFRAALCDDDSFTDMEDFAEMQPPWLRGFLTLEHGPLSHDIFCNVFMMLRPQAMLDILSQHCGPLQGMHIATDGKTLGDRAVAHNCSILSEVVLKVLRDHPGKLSLRRKRKCVSLDPSFRLQILSTLQA